MNATLILQDLRSQFGKRSVLYAEDIAELLGVTVGAAYSLKSRGGLNLPVVETGGRPGVSIYAVAEWLAGVEESSVKAKKAGAKASEAVPPVPPPQRQIKALGKHLNGLRMQTKFLMELDATMERKIFALELRAGVSADRGGL